MKKFAIGLGCLLFMAGCGEKINEEELRAEIEKEVREEMASEILDTMGDVLKDKAKEELLAIGMGGVEAIGQKVAGSEDKEGKTAEIDTEKTEKSNETDSLEDLSKNEHVEFIVHDILIHKEGAERYRDFMEFLIKVTNISDKDIAGIQGTLIINDMFGKKMKRIQFDYTDNDILSGESIGIDGLGYERNNYMADDDKLFATEFEKLEFIYNVKTIIFTDGETIEYD